MIVVLSLRGAADGLSLVVPHGDPTYYSARPTIAIPAASLLAADATFGLHPSLEPLLPMWNAGKLAAVHATGMRVPNRSHFSAMEAVEDADPGSSARIGWLNRLVGDLPGTSPAQGLSVGSTAMPTSLYGPEPVMAVTDLRRVQVAGAEETADPRGTRRRSLETVWSSSSTDLGTGVRSALAASIDLLPSLDQPDTASQYPTHRPRHGPGRRLARPQGRHRHHAGDRRPGRLGPPRRRRHRRLRPDEEQRLQPGLLDRRLLRRPRPLADKVTLVTISEFGRRIVENAQKGLDHGWGNVMFLAGAGVKGGQYYGKWPGLDLTLDADLVVTTDYRSVLAEVVAARTDASIATVFPGLVPEHVGVMQRT